LRYLRKITLFNHQPTESTTMDLEHINAIANALIDLTQRTIDLRGYL
jgi:hypothetical protein